MAYSDAELTALKNEIDPVLNPGGHPVTGAYNADAQLAAGEVNALNRDAPADPSAILDYLMTNEFRNAAIYGRIAMVAAAQASAVGDFGTLPTGASQAQVAIEGRHVAAAQAVLRLTAENASISSALTSTELGNMFDELTTGGGCECMAIADKTALQALSNNLQSRASELGLPRARAADVENARALP